MSQEVREWKTAICRMAAHQPDKFERLAELYKSVARNRDDSDYEDALVEKMLNEFLAVNHDDAAISPDQWEVANRKVKGFLAWFCEEE